MVGGLSVDGLEVVPYHFNAEYFLPGEKVNEKLTLESELSPAEKSEEIVEANIDNDEAKNGEFTGTKEQKGQLGE